jgi:hypothetical protein
MTAATTTDTLLVLLSNQTVNISSVPVTCPFSNGVLKVWGTWNGANVVINTSVPGAPGTFIPVTDANGNPLTFTQNTQVTLANIVYGDLIVAVQSASGAATNLNATIQKV